MTDYIPCSQTHIPEGMIDLGVGDPDFSLLPLDMLRRAAEACFARNDPAFLQYGAEQGDGYFRMALAGFLSRGYGFSVDPDTLFVTNGISNALDLICAHFTRPGDTIFVEEPTYFLALRIFADHDLRIVPIQTDENGLVIEALEEKLAQVQPKFLYIVPTFQNPGGHTLPDERRERLVRLSQEHDFLIVADEVYHFLNYSNQHIKPFAAYTDRETVISLNSFSKILAPGLRLGWMQAHPDKIKRLVTSGLLDSGGGLNPFHVRDCAGIDRGGRFGAEYRRVDRRVSFAPGDDGRSFTPGITAGRLQNSCRAVSSSGCVCPAWMPDNSGMKRGNSRLVSGRVSCFPVRGACESTCVCATRFTMRKKIEEGIRRLRQCLDAFPYASCINKRTCI